MARVFRHSIKEVKYGGKVYRMPARKGYTYAQTYKDTEPPRKSARGEEAHIRVIERIIEHWASGQAKRHPGISEATAEELLKRAKEYKERKEKMETLDVQRDWAKISMHNHKRRCIREMFERVYKLDETSDWSTYEK